MMVFCPSMRKGLIEFSRYIPNWSANCRTNARIWSKFAST